MVTKVHVEGFDAFMTEVAKHAGKELYVIFCGSRDKDDKSWCSDCVAAEPVVEDVLNGANLTDESVFIHCGVGPRDFWKDKGNIFRTHDKLKLKSVPTLLKWGTSQRLEEEQCAKKELVQLMFED